LPDGIGVRTPVNVAGAVRAKLIAYP
jgi:hypothetical protein